jgi:hypothetical protein
MILKYPFAISARLAPAVRIGDAWLSFDSGKFVLDFPDGTEHVVQGFRFPRCRIQGDTDSSVLQDGFGAVVSFLSACAESRKYALCTGRPGENADLFPEHVGAWAEEFSEELTMLGLEILETKNAILDS